MPPLPTPLRAALGLAATVLDEAKHLPDKAIELPMLAISRALQLSLRAQQRYSTLAARGDELLAARQTTDEAPPWATFDAPVENAPAAPSATAEKAAESAPEPPEPRKPRPRKTVRAPRNGSPSAFDSVGDDE